jgi:hypothetical protein
LYYARVLPPARPPVLDAVKRGLARHEAGLLRVARMGVGTHAQRVAHLIRRFSLAIAGFSFAGAITPGRIFGCRERGDQIVGRVRRDVVFQQCREHVRANDSL